MARASHRVHLTSSHLSEDKFVNMGLEGVTTDHRGRLRSVTDSDDPDTARSSGTIAVFERTATEAIERLDDLPLSEESVDLRREAVALQALFRSWSVRAPDPEERTRAISRVMDLHRAVEEYAARRID